MEQTRLQKIIEQKAEQIRIAIEEAIDEGAKIEKSFTNCVTIDEIFLQRNYNTNQFAVVLRFDSEKIAKVFEPSKDDLEKIAKQKRAELEEIEKQIKERE
jgi:hypothetical protein